MKNMIIFASPATGDSGITLYIILGVVAAAAILALFVMRRK
ncbi:MAG: LPXTG cell wall anchor domain-containing protein [Eubacteriales bacterium]